MEKELHFKRSCEFTENPPFPKNMLIELTNYCNHRCIFCHYRTMKRLKKECQKEFTFDILRQAFDNGCREIGFYMIGEPLLKKDLADYVAYAKKIGFEYIYLTSNGALATIERMKELIDAGLDSIKFSVNAATPEHYIKVHGADDYLTVKENIKRLHEYILENNVNMNVFVSFVKTEITKDDVKIIQKEFTSFVDKVYIFNVETQGLPMPELVVQGVVDPSIYLKKGDELCEMVFNRIHITNDGVLNACCSDFDGYLNAVDLHTMSLADAWHSDIMRNLRRRFLQKKLSPLACYNCIYKTDSPIKPLDENLFLRSRQENEFGNK